MDRVGIGERGLEMPDTLELPWMLRAVVELMSRQRFPGLLGRVVDELVAGGLRRTGRGRLSGRGSGLVPCFATVVGGLYQLAEPSAGLRGVDAVRIGGRPPSVYPLPSLARS